MEFEQQAYEVPGRELRWRVAQLKAQNLDYVVRQVGGGVYIVVVQQPVGAEPFAYAEYQRRRRPRLTIDGANILRWAAVLGAVAVVVAVLWFAFGPSDTVTAETGGMRLDPITGRGIVEANWWDWFTGLRLPWQQSAEQPSQQGGFRWPWDTAMESAAAAADSVQGTVTIVSVGVVAVLVLLIVLSLVRRRR